MIDEEYMEDQVIGECESCGKNIMEYEEFLYDEEGIMWHKDCPIPAPKTPLTVIDGGKLVRNIVIINRSGV